MSSPYQIKRRLLRIAPQVLITCVLAYFAYHIVEGKRGVTAWQSLTAELAKARAERAEVTARRQELEHRVDLLRSDSLDPDLLEERARLMLDFGRPTDFVILRSTLEPDTRSE